MRAYMAGSLEAKSSIKLSLIGQVSVTKKPPYSYGTKKIPIAVSSRAKPLPSLADSHVSAPQNPFCFI
jgi:hypothetical protein